MIDIAEERPSVDPKATERDGDVPPLPTSAMGVRSMARIGYQGVQGHRGLGAEAYEAGHKDGFGDGYVDGYDDGQYNQLIGLIRELDEEWIPTEHTVEGSWYDGVRDIIEFLRERLEHDP